jgi:hypothetical protein
MQPRINIATVSPRALTAMLGLESYLRRCGLDSKLLNLVNLRVSQINGWNRLSISFRVTPDTYQPAGQAEHLAAA